MNSCRIPMSSHTNPMNSCMSPIDYYSNPMNFYKNLTKSDRNHMISNASPWDSPCGRKRWKTHYANSEDVSCDSAKIIKPIRGWWLLVFARDSSCGRKTIPRFFAKKTAFGSARAKDSEDKHKHNQRMIMLHWSLRGIRHLAETGSFFIAIRLVGVLGPERAAAGPLGPARRRTGTPAANPRGPRVGQGILFISSDR